MSTYTGFWVDNPNKLIVNSEEVDLIANFVMSNSTEHADDIREKRNYHEKCLVPASLISLYWASDNQGISMFRWDNGLDLPLDTTDIGDAKGAVETMLKIEGVQYVR